MAYESPHEFPEIPTSKWKCRLAHVKDVKPPMGKLEFAGYVAVSLIALMTAAGAGIAFADATRERKEREKANEQWTRG